MMKRNLSTSIFGTLKVVSKGSAKWTISQDQATSGSNSSKNIISGGKEKALILKMQFFHGF